MLVPETSMNEHRFLARGKNEIGLSGQVFAVQAEAVAKAVKHPAQLKLRGCVLRAYLPHVSAAALCAELVHTPCP
jgi:hypothetical protein